MSRKTYSRKPRKKKPKIYKCLDIVVEENNLWNIKLAVVAIEDGILGTVLKGLENIQKKLYNRDKSKYIKTT